MALPQVVTLNFPTGNASTIAQLQGSTSVALQLNGTLGTALGGKLGTFQQRVTVTSNGNDSGIGFLIVGLNQANNTISEVLQGGNATVAQSVLDYLVVKSIAPVTLANSAVGTATATTVLAGTNGVGSCLWNILNWHADPCNLSIAGVITTIATAQASWAIQYCYDDPNNLPIGQFGPTAFFSTLNNMTTSLDGSINEPITAWRLLITGGTGTVRGTGIQAGIGSP